MTWDLTWYGLTAVERLVVGSLAATAAITAIAYLWPAELSGPLIPGEEPGARSTAGALVTPALLAFAVVACFCLVVDAHPRETAILVSRARTTEPDCSNVTWPTPAAESARANACTMKGVDLGPVVDEALEGLDATQTRTMSTNEVLDQLRPRLERAIERAYAHETTFPVASRRFHNLPRWIVDTVELEIIETVVADERVGKVVISPGASDKSSLWRTLGELEEDLGVQTVLVDEQQIQAGAYVEAVPLATYDRSGDVRVWAVVSGEIKSPQSFQFAIADEHDVIGDEVRVLPPDEFPRRLVQLGWQCPRCAQRDHELRLIASKDDVPTAEGQLVPLEQWRSLSLVLGPHLQPPIARALRRMAAPDFGGTRSEASLVEELDGLGLPLPRLAEAESRDAMLIDQEDRAIIVAGSAEKLAEARGWLGAAGYDGSTVGLFRFSNNKLGPNTVWSYEGVTTFTKPGLSGAVERGALTAIAADGLARDAQPTTAAGLGSGWGVATVPPPSEQHQTVATVPFLRAVIWLANHARHGHAVIDASPDHNAPGGQVRSFQGVRHRLREERLLTRYTLLAVVFFATCFFSMRKVRRQTHAKR